MVTGNKDITGFRLMKRVAAAGISWIAGYGAMWIMKWVIGSLILRENLFEGAFMEVLLRSGAQTYLPVEWKLQAGEAYRIQYSVAGNSSPVRTAVTDPGNEPLAISQEC